MMQSNSVLLTTDPDINRRRALAKVYSLLLRLAEEAENTSIVSDNPSIEEKMSETSQGKLNKEI